MRFGDIVPLHLATITFPEFHPLSGQEGVVRAFLVRHQSGPILVDTGIGHGNTDIDRWYRPKALRLESALAGVGADVGEITLAVNTHLHFDHCGQNQALGSRPIYVQSRELEAAQGPDFTVADWVNFPGANYIEIDGDYEVAPGVHLLSTPGHTPGHQSVVIETEDGPVVITGQAIYSAAEFEHIRATGSLPADDAPPNPEAYLASAVRILGLEPAMVLFSHDEVVLRHQR